MNVDARDSVFNSHICFNALATLQHIKNVENCKYEFDVEFSLFMRTKATCAAFVSECQRRACMCVRRRSCVCVVFPFRTIFIAIPLYSIFVCPFMTVWYETRTIAFFLRLEFSNNRIFHSC